MTTDEARQRLQEIIEDAGGDISAGLSQITVQTAGGYGIGDGTPDSWLEVKRYLFDRWQSINLGAVHLAGCYGTADTVGYQRWGISHDLAALVIYNAGTLHPYSSDWWVDWADNVNRYRAALAWAEGII